MKIKSIAAAAAVSVAALAGGTASAVTLGTISAPQNESLDELSLFPSAQGYFGANLYLSAGGSTDIEVTIIGSEAGYKNKFTFGSGSYTTPGGGNFFNPSGLPGTSWTVSALPGLLNFSFLVTDTGQSVFNGANPENVGSAPNFFVSFVHNQVATFGKAVYLFLDDGGAGNDDNHDDLVLMLKIKDGNISAVPLPAAGFLLMGALGGLAALRRRKTA